MMIIASSTMSKASFLLLFLLSAASLFSVSRCATDTLTPDQPLSDDADGGTFLISASEKFKLGFFSPIGSTARYIGIWYNKFGSTVVWVANRRRPITAGRSGRLLMASDGTLTITQANSTDVIWSTTGSYLPLGNPIAQLLDDGNFLVREASGESSGGFHPSNFAVWQSFDFPTDTLIPGMKLGWNLTSGLNRNLTAWRSAGDPSPGDYVSGIDLNGDPQLFIWSGAQQYWRGGAWNGLWFSGTPGDWSEDIMSWEVVMDPQQVYLTFNYKIPDPSTTTRLVMNSSGVLQRFMWVAETGSWNLVHFAPMDVCDPVSSCGPNSYCHPERTPKCTCLQGFQPKNRKNWHVSWDGSDGCVRKTNLDCANGTDGFAKQSSVKLPDTARSTVDRSVSLEQCKAACLKNCSCTAYASADINGNPRGCILWTGNLTDIKLLDAGMGNGAQDDLYVRLAAADLDLGSESNTSQRNHVVLSTVVALIAIFLLACVAWCVWKRKKKKNKIDEETERNDLDLPLFDLITVRDATDDFSSNKKLGEGGFGPVYKGKLAEGMEIAVKRLSETSAQGMNEFKNEISLIAKLQHRNLVRLLGGCIEGGERILIYEYMSNGSLDSYIFDDIRGALLDWQARYKIIEGIARGLLYLHHDSRFRIIHRDLKASNILLDKNMNPKISDFGMARIFGGEDAEVNTKRVVGTYGYMSPEYIIDGIFSAKSDIFSFGVLVLEIISGKKNQGVYHSMQNLNLLGHVWNTWKEGRCLELVDQSIGYSFSVIEVLRCLKIGLLCVQERPGDRPMIPSVLTMLGSDIALLPEPKQPGFFSMLVPSESDSSTSKQELLSINKISVTVLEGR